MSLTRPDARTLIDTFLDPGTWRSWDETPIDPAEPGSGYAEELAAVRAKTGYDEAVVSGEGLLDGRRVAVVASEFSFLAGSIGVAAAERLTSAIERATAERLPLLVAPASGGTRMQEGAVAFAQMVKITIAVSNHRAAGLPYVVYLRHPTTGGVFASWGSLGHVTAAEPEALIGFLGPRVFESLHGYPFPEGVQVSENLFARGLVDAVVSAEDARWIAIRALAVLRRSPRGAGGRARAGRARPADPGLGRDQPLPPGRPSGRAGPAQARRVRRHHAQRHRRGGERPRVDPRPRQVRAAPAVVLGQDRRSQRVVAPVGPAGLRVARRGMRLAAELNLPLVTVIDTSGAATSKAAEEGGLAAEIARSLADLVMLDAPTVCLLLGEGAGGAALALLPADRVLCAQHGWLSPLSPEGASALLYRSVDFAPEIATAQRVKSTDLRRDGVVDRVIPELPDAAYEPEAFCRRVSRALEYEIAGLLDQPSADRLAARLSRYRRLGTG